MSLELHPFSYRYSTLRIDETFEDSLTLGILESTKLEDISSDAEFDCDMGG